MSALFERVRPWVALARPANVVTAAVDVLAGYLLARWVGEGTVAISAFALGHAAVLALAGMSLYAGGILLNDVLDAALDARERPERPIPSGAISRRSAAWVAGGFLTVGLLLATCADSYFAVDGRSGFAALGVIVCVVLYNAWAKRRRFEGPVFMGACRAGNLLVGVAAASSALEVFGWVAGLTWLHVAWVTAVSQSEVRGGGRWAMRSLVASDLTIASILGAVGWRGHPAVWVGIALFLGMVLPPALRAWRRPAPDRIQATVRSGVLGLIPLNAALATLSGEGWTALLLLLFLPLSIGFSRVFAVT